MAAKVVDPTPGVSSTDKDFEESQDHDRNNETIISLERKDSLKARTLQKRGHLRLKEDGQTTYKRTSSSAIVDAIQLGIGYSVGRLSAKQERDILMQDFNFVEKVWFPASGSRETPSHRYVDFKFKSYAPSAFRYFRDLFGMLPSDFLMALSNEELREISNPGASGSMFFLSADDNFIIKTVQHKEATFLQQLLPGYYMNLHQNPRTLLPKFFGLYCYQSQNKNIRLAVMNNILPTTFKCHQVYDLKGSTFKRKASKKELTKKTPTKKDLDFRSDYPEGITMDGETYDAVVKTIRRDCRVLESFKIMDYSLLLGIHNIDQALREKNDASTADTPEEEENPERVARRAEFTAALEAIQIDKVEGRPLGGIPAKSPKGDRLILFLGVIDILQSYRLAKKLEHGWKSLVHDGDSVSVHNPSFYAKRFVDFVVKEVFKVIPSAGKGLNKRRSVQRQNQSATSSTPGGKFRSVQGSFSDSATPRGKDVKPKTPVVKFSEPMVINDEPPLDQMIPPPYESEVSTVSQDSATTATETSVIVSSEPRSEGGSSNTEPRQLETTVAETEISTVDTSVVEGRQESEQQVTEVSESVQSEHVVIVQSEHKVITTIESERTEQSEHKEEDVSRSTDAENTVEVAAPETRGESSSSSDNQPIASLETSNRVSSQNGDSPRIESAETPLVEPAETNDISLTLDTSYDVIEYPGNHTVTKTTTRTITKTVTVIENGEEHIVTSEGDNGITENHVVEFVKTAHVQDEDEEVLAGNSKPTLKLTDVKVQVDSDNNESVRKNKLLDCEEVTVM